MLSIESTLSGFLFLFCFVCFFCCFFFRLEVEDCISVISDFWKEEIISLATLTHFRCNSSGNEDHKVCSGNVCLSYVASFFSLYSLYSLYSLFLFLLSLSLFLPFSLSPFLSFSLSPFLSFSLSPFLSFSFVVFFFFSSSLPLFLILVIFGKGRRKMHALTHSDTHTHMCVCVCVCVCVSVCATCIPTRYLLLGRNLKLDRQSA